MRIQKLNVGIFHSGLGEIGGGEILVNTIGKTTNSKIYSLFKDQNQVNNFFDISNFVDISNYLPFIIRKFSLNNRLFDFLCWSCVDITELDNFDIIISCGETARAIVSPDCIPHVNYSLSPLRRIYDLHGYQIKRKNYFKQNLFYFYHEFLRIWDAAIDNRVDFYLAISPIIKKRLWKYLKRDSEILYPPIEIEKYKIDDSDDFYLYCSRLWKEKRPDEAIQACIKMNKKLVLVGTGPLEKDLKKKYKNYPLIEIRGFVSEEEKLSLLSSCKALIYPALAEDFGIVPIEAFASGKPIICSNDGFPPLVVNDSRGIITDGTIEGICKGIEKFESEYNYSPEELRKFAEAFDVKHFKENLINYLVLFKEKFDEKFKKD